MKRKTKQKLTILLQKVKQDGWDFEIGARIGRLLTHEGIEFIEMKYNKSDRSVEVVKNMATKMVLM